MATSRSKLPSLGTAAGTVTKGLLKIGLGLAETAGKIFKAVVGPEQEQTYGWTSQFFPQKMRNNKSRKVDSLSPKLDSIPSMNVGTDEILNLMKENYADEKRYREVQRSFAEERANEEEKRHKELVTALKKYTGTQTTATVVTPTEGEGLLDMIRNMFKAFEEKLKGVIEAVIAGISWLSELKALQNLGSLARFLGSNFFRLVLMNPLVLAAGSLAALLLLANDEKQAIEANPNDPKYKDNAYAMKLRGEAESVAQAGAMNQAEAGRRVPRSYIEDLTKGAFTDAELILETGQNKEELQKWLTENPKRDSMYQLPVRGALARRPTVAPSTDESPAERARLARGPAAVSEPPAPMTASPVPEAATSAPTEPPKVNISTQIPPAPSPVAQLTDMNRDLEMTASTTSGGSSGAPVIQQSNTQSAQNEPPIPSTATQRDDEPMSSKVFKDQRNRARAY
jgi:hypothetical protein